MKDDELETPTQAHVCKGKTHVALTVIVSMFVFADCGLRVRCGFLEVFSSREILFKQFSDARFIARFSHKNNFNLTFSNFKSFILPLKFPQNPLKLQYFHTQMDIFYLFLINCENERDPLKLA